MKRWAVGVFLMGCGGIGNVPLTDGGEAGADAPDSAASTVTITFGSCPALTPCGGDVTGTWNLSAGCADDPLATAKMDCPTLVVNSETGTASGSVTFSGGLVSRNYTAHYGMDITIPTACLLGGTCAQAQALYQAYIPNTTCTDVASGCECTGSLDSAALQASAYSTSNNEIVTLGGDHYAYCVNASGTQMQYHHVSGPTTELGTYTLTK